jgi:O-antigen ligase
MLLVSLTGLFATRNAIQTPNQSWEKVWLASIALFFGIACLNIAIFGDSFSAIDQYSRMVLAIPVYLYIRRVGVNWQIVLIGAAIGAILAAYLGWQQVGAGRADGFTNAVYYGGIVTLIWLFCLYGFFINKGFLLKSFFALSFFAASYAVITSGTRGAWIALPLLLLLFLYFKTRDISLFRRLISATAVLAVSILVYQFVLTGMHARFNTAMDDITGYYQQHNSNTSVGVRLEMWRGSWLIAQDNYFIGRGAKAYASGASKLINENRIDPFIARFNGPHSQYFRSLIEQGLLGFIALLGIFITPLYWLVKKLSIPDQSTHLVFFGGGVIVAFMVFMISVSALQIQIMSLFISFVLSAIVGSLRREDLAGNR